VNTQLESPLTLFLSPIIKLVFPVTPDSDPITRLLIGAIWLLIEFKYDYVNNVLVNVFGLLNVALSKFVSKSD
jgi:hypothetical protein